VQKAIEQVTAGLTLTAAQEQWLARIRDHLTANLSIDRNGFDTMPVLQNAGGWSRANCAFEGTLLVLLQRLNEAVAA